ncbi:hypothetical protein OG474_42260 [Kribbella sp. NBC_01505]|uniref:DUF6928 family protein n=1 Tax=Kribbella sp. NBC_01505 TaxID=2903580 RepID=UPI003869A592
MGSKAGVIMFAERDPREVFQGDLTIDQAQSQRLAEGVLGAAAEEVEILPLDLAIWPNPGIVGAASFEGLELVSSLGFARSRPSELTEVVSRLSAGRDAYGVFMQSTDDSMGIATWKDGQLLRALSMSPDAGVIEDIGERLPFEDPFWAGEHPLTHAPDYPLPFHPSDLGNEALKAFFGFILEGSLDDTVFDPEDVEIPVFKAAGRDLPVIDASRMVRRELTLEQFLG